MYLHVYVYIYIFIYFYLNNTYVYFLKRNHAKEYSMYEIALVFVFYVADHTFNPRLDRTEMCGPITFKR